MSIPLGTVMNICNQDKSFPLDHLLSHCFSLGWITDCHCLFKLQKQTPPSSCWHHNNGKRWHLKKSVYRWTSWAEDFLPFRFAKPRGYVTSQLWLPFMDLRRVYDVPMGYTRASDIKITLLTSDIMVWRFLPTGLWLLSPLFSISLLFCGCLANQQCLRW